MSNKWELEELEKALDEGDMQLARRYLAKALEQVRCMYCHGPLDAREPYHVHFKGYVHDLCSEKYKGRYDYMIQHPEELPFNTALDKYECVLSFLDNALAELNERKQ